MLNSGPAYQSRMSGPAITASINAASDTVRVSGPWCHNVSAGECGCTETTPKVGLKPNTPQKLAGTRMEPPPSVPRCSVPRPNAAATAAPPLLPPDVRCASQRLRVTPVSGLSVTAFQPNSDVVVFPKKTAPC